MRSTRFRFAFVLALIALSAAPMLAQVAATGIAGVVKGPTDAVISGANVKIYNLDTGVLERQMTTRALRHHSVDAPEIQGGHLAL